MDANKTHGAFSWSELATPQPGAASEFYGSLFGWTVETMDMGDAGEYRVAKLGDTSVGGIMSLPKEDAAGAPAWGCYVTVDNVDRTLEQCTALGGQVVMPPMDVPGVGRMAQIRDPQGATISVITYAMPG
ncbi:MAG: VOC family protein [Rubrivivax sp.]|nr:VOC family protein [Rubrivivax sp.]MDP3082290.1 VOC family protein [Rubrivivax sp.]